jgi:integrase
VRNLNINILQDPQFIEFVRARDYKPQSVTNYKNGLKFYCNFLCKTPTEIIREAIMEQKNDVWVTDRKIRIYFTSFVDYLIEIGNAPQTIRNKVNWVKTFYREYGIETPRVRIPRNKINVSLKLVPDKEIIIEALKRTNLRNQAIIILMASSGMGAAEIRSLTYTHFLTAINELTKDLTGNEKLDLYKIRSLLNANKVFGTWKIIRIKTNIPYITFSTPESLQSIIDHLIFQQENNKRLKSKKDYLFAVNDGKMKTNTFSEIFQHLNDRCGFGKAGEQRLFVSHNLRKFTANTLIDNGMDFYRVEWLLGHALPSTQAAYYKMNVDVMKEEYSKFEDYLTFNRKVNNPSAELFKMKKKITDMENMLKEQNELLTNLTYK